jgi:hypothetical protein
MYIEREHYLDHKVGTRGLGGAARAIAMLGSAR